ncbi:MAG: Aminoglycoside N(6')-acetyltransferase type 1 [Syntrophorhabdus sp. PtaU1.Bin058]|nr:MAG: Aminoglycoside N(6')-acetyltransferase type 1 [Syntrophorhabdus sp. PtaU1.Bin058]
MKPPNKSFEPIAYAPAQLCVMAREGMISIRKCDDSDFDGILSLLRQLWLDKPINPVTLKEVFGKVVASEHHTCFVAESDGGLLVGFVSLSIKDSLWQEGLVAHIEELVVDQKARGKGVGTALVGHTIAMARDRGCRRVELDSAHHREAAHRFYERLGFENRAVLFSMAL